MQGNEKFLRRVASYAHKYALWREGERILAAVSGGPDSLALLLALKLLAVKEKITLAAAASIIIYGQRREKRLNL
ncbi:MAG: hypothetical protein ACLUIQ_08860 [Dialister invisus]